MENLSHIRNLGIIAHIDAGKTSTTEGMLYYTGLTHRIGSIDDGTTVMDYLPEERARGITIIAAAATMPWQDHHIHLIDTPGHIDFTAEVERSLRVIDGAIVIFSGVEGVEAQSEKVWRQADRYHVPRLAFINKLDRIGASFPRVLEEINEKFGICALPIQAPVGEEGGFAGIVDLIVQEYITFGGANNEVVNRGPIPAELADDMRLRRDLIIERLADASDEIATLFLDGKEVPAALLHQHLHNLTLAGKVVPVLCGSAKKRLGIQPLLDAVLRYLPSPADVQETPALRLKDGEALKLAPDPAQPFAGLVFKVVANTSADLLYLRTYSGTLKQGATLINSRTKEKVRIKQILRLYAKNTTAIDKVGPGDIVGIIGPQGCGTGDTLTDISRPVACEKIQFPEPVISMAVEPKFSRDKDRLDEALGLMCREDPTLALAFDEDTGQRLFSGMGELHLEININRLAREFNVEAKVGDPRVAYRETFAAAGQVHTVFSKVFGDTELYAEAKVAVKPLARGRDLFRIESRLRNRPDLPKAFIETATKALGDGLRTGGSHGYPLIYVAAELLDIVTAPEKTTESAVLGACLQAIDQAIHEIRTAVLEPVMRLEIVAPDEVIGDITAYLHPRRTIIHEMLALPAGGKRISCEVPLAEMFGFGKALPKLSGGRASFSMEPCGYQELPREIAEKQFGYL